MKNKAIKHIEIKAVRNDVAAAFQLYEYYKSGTYVEKNDEIADSYLKQCINILNESKIEIESAAFLDFRKIKEARILFNSKMTVLVGNNGTGKTTILEGISYCLSWFNSEMGRSQSSAKTLNDQDINIHSEEFADISIKLKLARTIINANLSRPTEHYPGSAKSSLDEIRMIARLYRTINADNEINFPLFAYYSVDRSDIKGIKKGKFSETTIKQIRRLDGYKNALDGRCDFDEFSNWYVAINNISNNDGNEKYLADQIKNELSFLYFTYKKLHDMGMKEAAESINDDISNKKEQLNNLHKKLPSIYKRQIHFINEAFSKIIPGLTDIIIDKKSGDVDITFNIYGEEISASKCSKGQQTVLALIADLVRRLTILNPAMENPLCGQGIILIDEIELHLHPAWQQSILVDLNELFPNLQFIITTHSPQVLTTVKPEQIRGMMLSENNKIKIKDNYKFSEGAEAQFALEEILGVSSRPKSVHIVKVLDEYISLVRKDKWDSEEALQLRKVLNSWANGNEPALLAVDMDIRMREFRRIK